MENPTTMTNEQMAHWQKVADQLATIMEDESIPDPLRSELADGMAEVIYRFEMSQADHVRAHFAKACADFARRKENQ